MDISVIFVFLLFSCVVVYGENNTNQNEYALANDKDTRHIINKNSEMCLSKKAVKNHEHEPLRVWHDDECHQYGCESVDGRSVVIVLGCVAPTAPENATSCHEFVKTTNNVTFPECCPRLRCVVTVNNDKYTQIVGQPEEVFPMERLIQDTDPQLHTAINNQTSFNSTLLRIKKGYTSSLEEENSFSNKFKSRKESRKDGKKETEDKEGKLSVPKMYTKRSVIRKREKQVTVLYWEPPSNTITSFLPFKMLLANSSASQEDYFQHQVKGINVTNILSDQNSSLQQDEKMHKVQKANSPEDHEDHQEKRYKFEIANSSEAERVSLKHDEKEYEVKMVNSSEDKEDSAEHEEKRYPIHVANSSEDQIVFLMRDKKRYQVKMVNSSEEQEDSLEHEEKRHYEKITNTSGNQEDFIQNQEKGYQFNMVNSSQENKCSLQHQEKENEIKVSNSSEDHVNCLQHQEKRHKIKMYTKPIVLQKRATYHVYSVSPSPSPHFTEREHGNPTLDLENKQRHLEMKFEQENGIPYSQYSRRVEDNARFAGDDNEETGIRPMSSTYTEDDSEESGIRPKISSTHVYERDGEDSLKTTVRNDDVDNGIEFSESRKQIWRAPLNKNVNEEGIVYNTPRLATPVSRFPSYKKIVTERKRDTPREIEYYDNRGLVKDENLPHSTMVARSSDYNEDDTQTLNSGENSEKSEPESKEDEDKEDGNDRHNSYRQNMEEAEMARDERTSIRQAYKKVRGKFKPDDDEDAESPHDDLQDDEENNKKKRLKKKHQEDLEEKAPVKSLGAREEDDDDDLDHDEDSILSTMGEKRRHRPKLVRTPTQQKIGENPVKETSKSQSALDWFMWPFQAVFLYNLKIITCLVPFV